MEILKNAMQDGNSVRVQELVNADNVNIATDVYKVTVLHFACQRGLNELVSRVIQLGANINARDYNGNTPLTYVICNSHFRCVDILLTAGSDVSIPNKLGFIPLYTISVTNCVEYIDRIISAYTCGVCVSNKYGTTPLIFTVMFGQSESTLRLLIAGSVVDAFDNEGRTALYWALQNNKSDYNKNNCVNLLLDYGAQLENVMIENGRKEIPDEATLFVARRNTCRSLCLAILNLKRRRALHIGRNGRDILRLVAQDIWSRRMV